MTKSGGGKQKPFGEMNKSEPKAKSAREIANAIAKWLEKTDFPDAAIMVGETGEKVYQVLLAYGNSRATAMRERAAKRAEEMTTTPFDEWTSGYAMACSEIASAVRSLPVGEE